MGMNDCGGGPENVGNFKRMYGKVIEDIRKANGAAIILHTPQCITREDPNRFEKLPAYVEAVRELAAMHDTMLIDHFAEWSKPPVNISYWLSDAIHPNELGHRVMANALMRELGILDPNSHVCRLFYPH
jgi:lysophospholipase L1-like esterase